MVHARPFLLFPRKMIDYFYDRFSMSSARIYERKSFSFRPAFSTLIAVSRSTMDGLFHSSYSSSTLLSEGLRHHLSDRPFICASVVGRSVGRSVDGFSSERDAATRNKRALCPSERREGEREGAGKGGKRERDGTLQRKAGTEGSRELYRPTSLIQHPSYGAVGSSCS